jgi:beta-galactosidase beta subunit
MPISAGGWSPPLPEGPVVWVAQFTDSSDIAAALSKITERFNAEIDTIVDEPPTIDVTIREDVIVQLKPGDLLMFFGQEVWHFQYADISKEPILTRINLRPI